MSISAARAALEKGHSAVALAFSQLKKATTVEGRVSSSKLDDYQLVCFELAAMASELTGARFALDYADRAEAELKTAGSELERRYALLFTAEALHNVRGRMSLRLADLDLADDALAETLESADVRSFCAAQLKANRIAETGQLLLDNRGSSGAGLLDDRHDMMRTTFRQFANDVVMPRAEAIHREDLLIPDEILDALTEMGCFGLSIPEEYDGLHEDNMGMIVVTEELSRGSLCAAGSLITRPEILARALLKGGTEEQKQEWLPKLAAGDPLCAVAVTEPNYGSDVAGMQFKATKTEGGWQLNGAKSWCTFAGKAGVLMVLARTNPDPTAGHKGLSLFLAEKPSFDGHDFEHKQAEGGVISGRAIPTIGYRGMHSYDCFFDNYFVPDAALLGGPEGEGKGFYFTMAGFAGGRIQTAARALGVMQAAFEEAVKYAGERKVFGRPIGDYQLTLTKLARMGMALCACRQFAYGVGRSMDEGGGDVEASMVKLFASRTAEWVTREAQQIHGGMGYAEETAVSRYFLDARVLSIFEGAEEILALKVIAKALVDRAE